MAKVTVNSIGSGTGTGPAIDANFTAVAAAIEKQLSRDGTSPNQMEANLDMNSKRLVNVGNGINPQDGVNKLQVESLISAAGTGLISSNRDDTYSGDGSTVTFDVSVKVGTYSPGTNNLLVLVDGILQEKGAAYNEDSVGTNITFTTAPPSGSNITFIKNTATSNDVAEAASVNFQTATGALTRNVQAKLAAQFVDLSDFCVLDGVTDDTVGLQAAFTRAAALTTGYSISVDGGTGGTLTGGYGVPIVSPGGKIKITSAITCGTNIPFVSRGRTFIEGAGTHKGFVFDGSVLGYIQNVTFSEFTTCVEFDTNNLSLAYWLFKDVEFYNSTVGIDSKSYAGSRSTVLAIDGIRGGGCDTYVKSYCDVLWINRPDVWNKSGSAAAFVIDSHALISNGLLVPKNTETGARWVDFGPSTDQTRNILFDNVRFSGEFSGIPAVYNYIDGSSSSRDVTGIHFNNCYIASGAGGPSNAGGAVILTDDGANSTAPNHITFNNCVINGPAANVAVKTEAGNAISNSTPVKFYIYADEKTIYSATAGLDTSTYSFVQSGLEQYYSPLTRKVFTERKQISSTTGSITLNVLQGRFVRLAQAGATTITGFTNAVDGDEIVLLNTGGASNVTVQDRSVAGNLYLQGAANFNLTANDSLVLAYEGTANVWIETSRSAN